MVNKPSMFFSFRRRDSDYRFQGLSLYKELIYTAFSRARDRCYLHPEAANSIPPCWICHCSCRVWDVSLEQWVGRNQRQVDRGNQTWRNAVAQAPEWLSKPRPWLMVAECIMPSLTWFARFAPWITWFVAGLRWLSMEWNYTSSQGVKASGQLL